MQNPTCSCFIRFHLAGVLMQCACGGGEYLPVCEDEMENLVVPAS